MKLTDIKILKEEAFYKRIMLELKINGFDEITSQFKNKESVDHLDIITTIIEFLDKNKKVLKKIKGDKYHNVLFICINDILEINNLPMNEAQINKILKLLKNTVLVKNTAGSIMNIFNCCRSFKNTDIVELIPELIDNEGFNLEILQDLIPESVMDKVSEIVPESVMESVMETVMDKVSEVVPESVMETVMDKVSEVVPESVMESVMETVMDKVSEVVPESVMEKVSESLKD